MLKEAICQDFYQREKLRDTPEFTTELLDKTKML
jgi:hypothetical protein